MREHCKSTNNKNYELIIKIFSHSHEWLSCAENTKKFASDIVKKSDDAFNDDTTVIHGERRGEKHIKKCQS
jgi:hypothetical protein